VDSAYADIWHRLIKLKKKPGIVSCEAMPGLFFATENALRDLAAWLLLSKPSHKVIQ
jgi:hypothetical protein